MLRLHARQPTTRVLPAVLRLGVPARLSALHTTAARRLVAQPLGTASSCRWARQLSAAVEGPQDDATTPSAAAPPTSPAAATTPPTPPEPAADADAGLPPGLTDAMLRSFILDTWEFRGNNRRRGLYKLQRSLSVHELWVLDDPTPEARLEGKEALLLALRRLIAQGLVAQAPEHLRRVLRAMGNVTSEQLREDPDEPKEERGSRRAASGGNGWQPQWARGGGGGRWRGGGGGGARGDDAAEGEENAGDAHKAHEELRGFVHAALDRLEAEYSALAGSNNDELESFVRGLSQRLKRAGRNAPGPLKGEIRRAMLHVWDVRDELPGAKLSVPNLRDAVESLLVLLDNYEQSRSRR